MRTLEERATQAEGYTQIINAGLIFVAVVEAAAWATFGTSFWSQAAFIGLAVLMVLFRPWLINTRILALYNGNDKLASQCALWMNVSLAITAFSLLSLFSEAMTAYRDMRVLQVAPVQAAQARVEQAQAALDALRAGNPNAEAEASAAAAKKAELESQLAAATHRARAQHAAQVSAVEAELSRFWASKDQRTGFTYSQILGDSCAPKKTGYGLMTTDARRLCPSLKAIQAKMQNLASDPEVERLTSEIASIAGSATMAGQFIAAKQMLAHEQEALHEGIQSAGVSGDTGEVYPAVFHRLSRIFGNNITADQFVSLFGTAGILLILFSLNLFQEGRLLALRGDDGRIHHVAAQEASKWTGFFNAISGFFKKKDRNGPDRQVDAGAVAEEPALPDITQPRYQPPAPAPAMSLVESREPMEPRAFTAVRARMSARPHGQAQKGAGDVVQPPEFEQSPTKHADAPIRDNAPVRAEKDVGNETDYAQWKELVGQGMTATGAVKKLNLTPGKITRFRARLKRETENLAQ